MEDSNCVYFSKHLRMYKCWPELEAALHRRNIEYGFIPSTKDIWVRDFMPVQFPFSSFASYVYNPDYLWNAAQTISDGKACLCELFPEARLIEGNILLDGGNFVRCGNKVVMTDKVIHDNSIEKVETFVAELGLQLVLIPWDRYEPFGHADGMLQYIGNDTVLLTNYCDLDPAFRNSLVKAISSHFAIKELHFPVAKKHKWNWAYINYFQVGNVVFMPRLNSEEDELAKQQIQNLLSVEVEMIDCSTLLRRGGGLHCVSWEINKEMLVFLQEEKYRYMRAIEMKQELEKIRLLEETHDEW